MTNHRVNLHWFKRHPEFLKLVSTALSNDSNYHEIHQSRDNLFLSHGSIIVRLNKTNRHPIIIIYTDATPYQLPIILPLKNELSIDKVNELSKLTISEVYNSIKPNVKFYHHLRHQNSSGALCVVEPGALDEGAKIFSISDILQRLRDWYAGHVTGNFPIDNEEVEYYAHFSHVNREIQFLYPDAFLNNKIVAGQFYATLIRNFSNTHTYIYYGSLIDGQSPSGIQNNASYLFKVPIHKELVTSVDFQMKSDLVKSLIESKQLVSGIWFRINSILPPFEGFFELTKIIGNGEHEVGVRRFAAVAESFFRKLHEKFFVGIQYPNNKGHLEFQLFLVVEKETPPVFNLGLNPDEKMRAIIERYDRVEAISSEKITEENFHQRNSLRAKREILKEIKVNLLGVGSLGSEIGDSFSKAGIGTIMLIDNQNLRAHNAVRHVAGLGYVGVSKVHAMQELMSDHNPFVNILTLQVDILNFPDLMLHLPEKSITVSSIADDNVEGFINEQAVAANKIVFYVRALRGGKVGRIFRVIPGKDACLQCLSLYLSEKDSDLKIEEDPAFPMLKNECNNPILPSSAADLKMLSSIAARLIIEYIQEGSTSYNHWIWSTEKLSKNNIDSPYTLLPSFKAPHPQCFYCNVEKKISVSISRAAIDFMKKLVKEKNGTETGGVLAGVVGLTGDIEIVAASEPGPKAIHKVAEFRKDVGYCQAFLDKIYVESVQRKVYVGEWHSHPGLDNRPSGLDILSLSEIAQQKEYLTASPVMIIFSNSGVPSCTVHPVGKAHYFTDLNIIETSTTV